MKAFSLIELLVVIAILGILTALAAPAFNSVSMASKISRSGVLVGDQIALARQEAASKNRDVEVRIVEIAENGFTGWRGVQLWIANDDGTMRPLDRIVRLPAETTIMDSTTFSPLLGFLSGTLTNGTQTMRYGGFRVRSNGYPDQAVTIANNFLTVRPARESGTTLGANFSAVRVHPLTGRVSTHQP
jgi:uncharacterized protein (TIGR02596 family)